MPASLVNETPGVSNGKWKVCSQCSPNYTIPNNYNKYIKKNIDRQMNRKTPIGRVVLSSQTPHEPGSVWFSLIQLHTSHPPCGCLPWVWFTSPLNFFCPEKAGNKSGQTTIVKLLINPLKLNMEHNCLDFDPYRDPYQWVFHGSFWATQACWPLLGAGHRDYWLVKCGSVQLQNGTYKKIYIILGKL